MVWSSTSPEGSLSVATNVPIQLANTAYTEATLNLDHYWNIGAGEDGHHKWVQNVATNDADSTLATNVLKAADMDSIYYSRFVTATEVPGTPRECYPWFKNAGTNVEGTPFPLGVMQLLGMRAFAVVDRDPGTGVLTHRYSYNVVVTQTGTGKFLGTYGAIAMPSQNYGVIGGALSNAASNGGGCQFSVQATQASGSPGTTKGTLFMRFNTYNQSGTLEDPLQIYFFCFGG